MFRCCSCFVVLFHHGELLNAKKSRGYVVRVASIHSERWNLFSASCCIHSEWTEQMCHICLTWTPTILYRFDRRIPTRPGPSWDVCQCYACFSQAQMTGYEYQPQQMTAAAPASASGGATYQQVYVQHSRGQQHHHHHRSPRTDQRPSQQLYVPPGQRS